MLAGMPKGVCTEKMGSGKNPKLSSACKGNMQKMDLKMVYAPAFQPQLIALDKVGMGKEAEKVNAKLLSFPKQRFLGF